MKKSFGLNRAGKILNFDRYLRKYISNDGEMDDVVKISRLSEVVFVVRANILLIVTKGRYEFYCYERVFKKLLHIINIFDKKDHYFVRVKKNIIREGVVEVVEI
eukprot:snap_masked-scaffold_12-processed-gene-12.16-mRNA-1 protein AED:1.00 eAED:1.00 QI:0/-1/0/0/-1/1/1/0/103